MHFFNFDMFRKIPECAGIPINESKVITGKIYVREKYDNIS